MSRPTEAALVALDIAVAERAVRAFRLAGWEDEALMVEEAVAHAKARCCSASGDRHTPLCPVDGSYARRFRDAEAQAGASEPMPDYPCHRQDEHAPHLHPVGKTDMERRCPGVPAKASDLDPSDYAGLFDYSDDGSAKASSTEARQ